MIEIIKLICVGIVIVEIVAILGAAMMLLVDNQTVDSELNNAPDAME